MNTPESTPQKNGGPTRSLLLYGVVFLLMALLDAGRFASFLERAGIDFPPAAVAGQALREIADVSGLAFVSRTEEALVSRFVSDEKVGGKNVPSEPESIAPVAPPEVTLPPLEERAVSPLPPSRNASRTEGGTETRKERAGVTERDETLEETETNVPPAPHKPRILLIGDSMMMEGFGPVLQRTLRKRTDIEVIREGKYSTGLSRMDYFDWPAYLETLVRKKDPDIIVICMGANDPQDIIESGRKRHHADSATWGDIYQARAERLLRVATARGANVIWMGLPIMSKQPYASRIVKLTRRQEAACRKVSLARFVDSTAVLADKKGNYTTFLTDETGKHIRLRYKDMVHVTEDGGKLLTANLLPFIEKSLRSGQWRTRAATTPAVRPETDAPVSGPKEAEKGPSPSSSREHPDPTEEVLPNSRILNLHSVFRGKDVPCRVYLPAQARPSERFPVLYVLHGVLDTGVVWNKEAESLFSRLATEYGLILVAPFCEPRGWYVDSPLQETNQIERFIMAELVPFIERKLPVEVKRGVMGISMGGHGALGLALRHPGVFTSASSLSGVVDITRHPTQWKIRELLGPLQQNRPLWESYSPLYLLHRLPPAQAPAMLISVGSKDSLVIRENRDLRDRLRERGFVYQYRESPGTHDWTYWLAELPRHAAFHAARLHGDR